jgi:hypothetical protein
MQPYTVTPSQAGWVSRYSGSRSPASASAVRGRRAATPSPHRRSIERTRAASCSASRSDGEQEIWLNRAIFDTWTNDRPRRCSVLAGWLLRGNSRRSFAPHSRRVGVRQRTFRLRHSQKRALRGLKPSRRNCPWHSAEHVTDQRDQQPERKNPGQQCQKNVAHRVYTVRADNPDCQRLHISRQPY